MSKATKKTTTKTAKPKAGKVTKTKPAAGSAKPLPGRKTPATSKAGKIPAKAKAPAKAIKEAGPDKATMAAKALLGHVKNAKREALRVAKAIGSDKRAVPHLFLEILRSRLDVCGVLTSLPAQKRDEVESVLAHAVGLADSVDVDAALGFGLSASLWLPATEAKKASKYVLSGVSA